MLGIVIDAKCEAGDLGLRRVDYMGEQGLSMQGLECLVSKAHARGSAPG